MEEEKREFTQEEKLQQLQQFVMSPIWTDILKPTIYLDFQKKVRELVGSTDPEADRSLKAEIKAWGSLLDFEKSAIQKIRAVQAELEEQKRLAIQALEAPGGTPYGR